MPPSKQRFCLADKRVDERYNITLSLHAADAKLLRSVLEKTLELHRNPAQVASFTAEDAEIIEESIKILKKVF